jgi:hypothetical protein
MGATAEVPVERVFGVIVRRLLLQHQSQHRPEPLSDVVMSKVLGVSQPHWQRIRSGGHGAGGRVISAAAVAMPDVLRAAIDEVQILKAAEAEPAGTPT